MFDPLVAANLARCSGDGLELILEPSRGDVLSEVGPEPSAATGDLCPAFERLLGRDREAAEASAWLPGRSWLAAKLFTRLRRFRSGCRATASRTTLETVSAWISHAPDPVRDELGIP